MIYILARYNIDTFRICSRLNFIIHTKKKKKNLTVIKNNFKNEKL